MMRHNRIARVAAQRLQAARSVRRSPSAGKAPESAMLYFFYSLPLGLDVRVRRPPWATGLLTSALLATYALQLAEPSWLLEHAAYFSYVPATPHVTAVLLSAYLHADLMHLVGNLVALWVFAPALEERLGTWRFAVLYQAGAAAACLFQAAWSVTFMPATAGFAVIGASGAVAALMGLALVRLYFARVRIGYWAFMPLQAFTRGGAVQLPVAAAVGLWFLLQIGVLVVQSQGGGSQVALGSHLGGLGFGLAVAFLAGLRAAARDESELHRGRGFASGGQWYAAQGHFAAYVQSRPSDPLGHLELARALRVTHRRQAADAHYRRAGVLWADVGRWDRVEATYQEAQRGSPDFVFDPALQLQLAQLYERTLQLLHAETAYVGLARQHADHESVPLALFRAARLARARGARSTARELLGRIVQLHSKSFESELARAELARLRSDSTAVAA